MEVFLLVLIFMQNEREIPIFQRAIAMVNVVSSSKFRNYSVGKYKKYSTLLNDL